MFEFEYDMHNETWEKAKETCQVYNKANLIYKNLDCHINLCHLSSFQLIMYIFLYLSVLERIDQNIFF